MLGPTLIVHGTEEQKRTHLSRILKGEVVWRQGWSEPGAGSDLASLSTRAERDGDDYVLNGQKIWTSGAQHANSMYMLARTDPDAPKQRGISLFMLDMKSPGANVQPLTTMADMQSCNEVFFEHVRVPASQILGKEHRGWYAGTTLMDYERSGIGSAAGIRRQLDRLLTGAKLLPEAQQTLKRDQTRRIAYAERLIEAEIARNCSDRVISMPARGLVPNHESFAARLFSSELGRRLAELALKLFGLYGNLWDRDRSEALGGRAATAFLSAVSATIAGGTSEVQRNVIATRGLSLPRG